MLKYVVYGIIHMVLFIFSIGWMDTFSELFIDRPSLEYAALVTIGAYTLYKGICGIVLAAINLYIAKLERGINESAERGNKQKEVK